MSFAIYLAILIALAIAGFLAGRWLLIIAVLVMWVVGLAIAGLAGAYHQTREDPSGLLLFFAAWDSMFWVLAFILGTIARRTIHWATSRTHRRHHVNSTPIAG